MREPLKPAVAVALLAATISVVPVAGAIRETIGGMAPPIGVRQGDDGSTLQRTRKPSTTSESGPAEAAPTQLAILIAEDRRAPTPRDLATLRAGLRDRNAETIRIAVRALGRLERPDLIADIMPVVTSPLREVRAEAANAIGQAAQGWKAAIARRTPAVRATGAARPAAAGFTVDTAADALIARLPIEADATVRAALCQTIGRLPYTEAAQVRRAEAALTEALAHDAGVEGRLGVAQGFEALLRLHGTLSPPSAGTLARLRELAAPIRGPAGGRSQADPAHDARVRRLALEALIGVNEADEDTVVRASGDPDAQVRRLAVRAASARSSAPRILSNAVVTAGLSDPSAIVRIDALRAARGGSLGCEAASAASRDADPLVGLVAIDSLAACAMSSDGSGGSDAIAVLESTVNDLSQADAARGWHRGAHAIVALASAAPDRAKASLSQFAGSRVWQLRMYAARAAIVLKDPPTLEKLAADEDENVCETAIDGLSRVSGHTADAIYMTALGRRGYHVVRAAARALTAAPPMPEAAIAPLKAALQRLTAEGRDNSRDARLAVSDALRALGQPVPALTPPGEMPVTSELSVAELRRLASARARVSIRGVGSFELALFTTQAPASVVRFARLAESGYYNGLTFHRVVPNFVVQGGSPAANEYVGDATFMRDEVGLWPHVRGAVGISTRGRDTGDAQIFIDLVDNPRLDHDYTVFAQVLNGMDVVDRILEGDVIERLEIVL